MNFLRLTCALLVLVSFSMASPISDKVSEDKEVKATKAVNYRLTKDIFPENYKIELIPYLEKEGDHEQFTFDGKCTILIQPQTNVKQIILHKSVEMKINVNEIKLTEENSDEPLKILVDQIKYDNVTEFYTMPLEQELDKTKKYKISFVYIGFMNDQMSGFYRSSYTEDGKTKWIATTQFQPTHARKAFPCFDEPLFKATFDISIIRPKHMATLGNMKHLRKDEVVADHPNRLKDTFKTTLKMSSYIVAFVVSEFKSVSQKPDQEFDVWARPNAYTQGQYSYDIGKQTLVKLEEFTGYKYRDQGMEKMDMVALPDFSAGAMENWGLLTFRETALLYDENVSTEIAKQRIATVVAHEQAHMWFGDLVTCDWWEHTWLNEGFARYLQYYATDKAYSKWNLMEQIVVEQQQTVFGMDSLTTSKALSSHVDSSASISAHFDSISYNKGASVIRMMEHIVGTDNFQKALKNYLKAYEFKTVVPENLFSEIQKEVADKSLDISKIMHNWVFKNGYPVINVEQAADKLVVRQKRFLRHNEENAEQTKYYIPLSYTSKSEKKFSTKPKAFLDDQSESIQLDLPNKDYEWVVFNIKGTGYYRVNYDEQTWKLLTEALREDNFDGIETLSRAQLVDDALSLARAEDQYLDYETALELIHYLQHETSYLPWTSAFQGFSYIYKRLAGHDGNRHEIETYMQNLMKSLYEHLGFQEKPDDDPVTKYNRAQAMAWACKVGNEDCIKNAKEMFAEFKNGTAVSPNLRQTVYCTALRHGDGSDYDFLRDKYSTANVAAEQALILGILGCTKDETKLNQYLKESITDNSGIRKQDATSVFTSVYSGNPENVRIAFDFLKNNYEAIAKYYTAMNGLNNAVSGLASSLTTKEDVDELEEFLNKHATEMGIPSEVTAKAIQQAKTDLDWNQKYSTGIMDWIKRTNSSPAIVSSLFLCLIGGVVTLLL